MGNENGDLVPDGSQDVSPPPVRYERGLPAGQVFRGALLGFFPTSLLSLSLVIGGLGLAGTATIGEVLTVALATCGSLTLGFGLGLEGLRRWLYPDAGVDGRRSLVAGLMSPLAAFSVIVIDAGMGVIPALALCGVVGLVIAVLMFFAWLSPTENLTDPLDSPDRLPG